MSGEPRIVRLYSRMLVGGAEQHINQLLAGFPGSEMVVAGPEGPAAVQARQLAARYTHVESPRLTGIVEALRGADLVHIHTVNNEPVLPLAVQLAGVGRIVQTVHNTFEARYCQFVDHSFLIGVDTIDWIETPALSSQIGEGVPVPDSLPDFTPWAVEGRPIRLVEVRREDKSMAWTLEEVLASGALDGLDWEAWIVGVGGESSDPRVHRVGEQETPDRFIEEADILVHGSATETFGRTVYEAMSLGTLPMATPIPAFSQRLIDGEQVFLASDMTLEAGAKRLREIADRFATDPQEYLRHRAENFEFVRKNASGASMLESYRQGYQRILSADLPAPRSFTPDDVSDSDLVHLGEIFDQVMSGNGLAKNRLDLLTPSARGIALWFLADTKLVRDDQRVPLLRKALDLLGPRLAVCLSLAGAARHRNQRRLAAKAFDLARQANPYVTTSFLELVDYHLGERNLDAARAELEALLVHTPGHPLAIRYLEQIAGRGRARERKKGLFQELKRFKRIIVTGPHRSGTTVAAEMIARDTGFEAVREEQFDFYRADMLEGLLQRDQVVVQCPALFDQMPSLSCDDTAIVLMRRSLEELEASRGRMFAPGTGRKMSADEQNESQLVRLGRKEGDAAELKYQIWAEWVKSGDLHNPIEMEYAALAEHPMWVSKDDRRKLGSQWHNRRTQL